MFLHARVRWHYAWSTEPFLRNVGTRYVYKARAGGFVAKPSRTRNLFSTLGRSIGTSKRLFVTYLAGPLWVIKQAQWISVEQGHCTLAVVKRYWSVPRML